jgi:hypothetical protein
MKKNPKRVGATLERAATKRFIQRLRKNVNYACWGEDTIDAVTGVIDQIETYLMKRFDRISKDKGGL